MNQPIIPNELSEKIAFKSSLSPLQRGNGSNENVDESPLTKLRQSKSIIEKSPTEIPGKRQLSSMKKNLDHLYKEVILALTSENASAKEEKEINEQSLVKIEKKVNDTLLLLNDYMEIIRRR